MHIRCTNFALQKRRNWAYIPLYRKGYELPVFEETDMNPIRYTKSWLSYRRTVKALNKLPNDRLSDIGLNRFEIQSIAARSFR